MLNTPMLSAKVVPATKVFIITCITLLFWLLHTNQSSSQSAATLLLLFAPFSLFFIKDSQIIKHKSLILTFSLIIFFAVFNFLILTQHEFNKQALASYRALFFWLLFPIASVLIWKAKPSKQWIFIVFSLAAIFSLSPVIRDYINGIHRGASSGHPIFWGNIALCSGVIAFALRTSIPGKSWTNYLGYIALVCGITASIWSQTRGGWISIPVSFLLLIALRSITKLQATCAIVIIIIAASSIDTIKNRIAYTFQFSNIFTEEIKLGNSTQVRLDMWQAAFEIFKQKPFFGNGFNYYQKGAQELVSKGEAKAWVSQFEKPHNEYFNTLVSSGIVGLLTLGSIIFSIMFILYKFPKNSPFKLAGYLLVTQFLVFSISEVFFSTKLTIVYFCIASALIIYSGLIDSEDSKLDNQ